MDPAPGDHATRTASEKAVCEEMQRQRVSHEHRSLHFRVSSESGETTRYDPALVAHRGPILFLIEALEDPAQEASRVELLVRFLEQHSPEIVLVVVVPRVRLDHVPVGAYDEVYPSEDLAAVVRRIREQDPLGMIRPFLKRQDSAGGGDSRGDGA